MLSMLWRMEKERKATKYFAYHKCSAKKPVKLMLVKPRTRLKDLK